MRRLDRRERAEKHERTGCGAMKESVTAGLPHRPIPAPDSPVAEARASLSETGCRPRLVLVNADALTIVPS
jgi:hypothetical protein